LDSSPAYKKVFDEVERRILSGALRPGDVMPSETKLAEEFGVNRSTIREGIRLLEQSGMVQRLNGGKKLRVTLPHHGDLASRASRAMVMHQITFRELWEASLALEVATIHHAADRITVRQLARLKENVREMEQAAARSDDEFIRLDMVFHDILAEAAGNRALALAREPVGLLFFPAGRIILPRLKSHMRLVEAHRNIVRALQAGDRDLAVEWMHKHMADFRRGYELTRIDMNQPLDAAASQPAV
jgi:DNA-binding FadR family transcriptional regulator